MLAVPNIARRRQSCLLRGISRGFPAGFLCVWGACRRCRATSSTAAVWNTGGGIGPTMAERELRGHPRGTRIFGDRIALPDISTPTTRRRRRAPISHHPPPTSSRRSAAAAERPPPTHLGDNRDASNSPPTPSPVPRHATPAAAQSGFHLAVAHGVAPYHGLPRRAG